MRIAVDLDGVLADTMVKVCEILNKRLSTQFSVESFNQWNAWRIAGISRNDFFRTLDEAWFSWQELPPTEENLSSKISQIRKYGQVDIVTGRSWNTVAPAKLWLNQQRINYDSFLRTANSTDGKTSLNYDVYIDDNAELMTLLTSRLRGAGILYLQPWNKSAEPMSRIFKVRKWDEIPAVLDKLQI